MFRANFVFEIRARKVFIGTFAENKLSVDKTGNKTPEDVYAGYIIVVDL